MSSAGVATTSDGVVTSSGGVETSSGAAGIPAQLSRMHLIFLLLRFDDQEVSVYGKIKSYNIWSTVVTQDTCLGHAHTYSSNELTHFRSTSVTYHRNVNTYVKSHVL